MYKNTKKYIRRKKPPRVININNYANDVNFLFIKY